MGWAEGDLTPLAGKERKPPRSHRQEAKAMASRSLDVGGAIALIYSGTDVISHLWWFVCMMRNVPIG